MNYSKKIREGFFLLIVTLFIFWACSSILANLEDVFEKATNEYETKSVINLVKGFSVNDLTKLLLDGAYFSDEKDARLVAEHISDKLKGFNVDDLTKLMLDGDYLSDEKDAQSIAEYISKNLKERKPDNPDEQNKNEFSVDYLTNLLLDSAYFLDKKDVKPVAEYISNNLKERKLNNLGALNKIDFYIDAARIERDGGEYLQDQLNKSREALGLNKGIDDAYKQVPLPSSEVDLKEGENQIIVTVSGEDPHNIDQWERVWIRLKKKRLRLTNWVRENILHRDGIVLNPESGVLVQLRQHDELSEKDREEFLKGNTIVSLDEKNINYRIISSDYKIEFDKCGGAESPEGYRSILPDKVLDCAMTDADGKVVFSGLADGYYSVLPINKNFEYGASQGTGKEKLQKGGKKEYSFTQTVHKIRPFDKEIYDRLKSARILTIRTPAEFKDMLKRDSWLLLIWFIPFLWCCIRKKETNPWILPLLMILTSYCVFVIYAMQNPLMDTLNGHTMTVGVVCGVIALWVLTNFNLTLLIYSPKFWLKNLKRFTERRFPTLFSILNLIMSILQLIIKPILSLILKPIKPITNFINKKRVTAKWLYLVLCLGLLGLLFLLGTGPEGTDAKIELFFFQPGEIVKYLVVVFLALYFCDNADDLNKIIKVKGASAKRKFTARGRRLLGVFILLLALIVIYIFLSDMGPALVLALTFIVIYSAARKDLPALFGGAISYIFLICLTWFFFKDEAVAQPPYIAMVIVSIAWLACWLLYCFKVSENEKNGKVLRESAVFMNMVIAAFIFCGILPKVGQRLNDRMAIFYNKWDNNIFGGDQITQGLWAIATGGWTGQGLGKGNPNLIPASNTDMIFASIGEELGLIFGLLPIIVCLGFLLWQSLKNGREAKHPFAFYLAAGIAVATGVQFFIITAGGLGLIPLTGIASPFLSYGRTSMIINIAAFGVVYSLTQYKNTPEESFHDVYVGTKNAGKVFYIVAFFALLVFPIKYFDNSILVKPAFTSDQLGRRKVVYNPRIDLLKARLEHGNIYDRNGLLLATSDVNEVNDRIKKNEFSYAGVDAKIYNDEVKLYKSRYYPFGSNMLFMTGDSDLNLAGDDINIRGYVAEHRHFSCLRGFDTVTGKWTQDMSSCLRETDNNQPKKKEEIKYSNLYRDSRFLPPIPTPVKFDLTEDMHNYSPLIEMLKYDPDGVMVERFNSERESRDLKLTVDARLQTKMQNSLRDAFEKGDFRNINSGRPKRVSVVALNAANGELLSSALYPLPDRDKLAKLIENRDNDTLELRETYRDLGLTYPTQPGSTVKIMDALAGFMKYKDDVKKMDEISYRVHRNEIIHDDNGSEPYGSVVGLKDAIVQSSNVYFIKLVNKEELYDQLTDIYLNVGVEITPFVDEDGRQQGSRGYRLDRKRMEGLEGSKSRETILRETMQRLRNRGVSAAQKYSPNGIWDNTNRAAWQLAWGQDPIATTPLAMARVVSIIANNGNLAMTKYTLEGGDTSNINIVGKAGADKVKGYMKKQATYETVRNGVRIVRIPTAKSDGIGGKTGTPQRDLTRRGLDAREQDGWFVFFVENSPKIGAPLAVAVRIELGRTSGNAMNLTNRVILPVLRELGYLKK